jgi:hypothetical protein
MAHTTELHITASEIRRGDVFTLHGHEHTAIWPAYVTFGNHVHLKWDGGDATIPADRPLTVTRTVPSGLSPRCTCGETACESELCDCDSVPCPVDHAAEDAA